MVDFGVTGKLRGYYLAEQYRRTAAAGVGGGVGFAELAAAKAAEQSNVSGMSFKDMWQTRFPGAYYHTMDAYKIPQGIWGRLDFPHEKFFSDDVDESIMNWKPTGPEPKMTDASVQSRAGANLGQKSIVVPPALEEKMKNDHALARQVMAKVESYIVKSDASTPDRVSSYVIVLDEEGKIARTCAVSGGGISGPTEAEIRQFEAEQAAKRKRREEYARLNEESALKRKLQEQLQKTGKAGASKADVYTEYLRSKYGNVRIQSVGKDQQSLDRAGKSMSGSDVVIAPNILEQMANDPEKAAYYEGKIDDFFNATPGLKAQFAAQGLDYQPCGVVVHEDGSVTYIGGCADSPERVAEVNAINKAKREKEAAQRKASLERSREAADILK